MEPTSGPSLSKEHEEGRVPVRERVPAPYQPGRGV